MVANRLSRGLAACLATGALAAATGCSTSASGGRASSSTSPGTTSATSATTAPPSATSTSTSPDVRTIAVDVYLAMWADMVEAAKTSDYASPRLADHAAGQALQLLSGALRTAHDKQLVAKGTPRFSPKVTGLTPQVHPVAVSL